MNDQNNIANCSPNDFNIGDIVFEKYEILSFIAAGGGGRVYKAHDNFRNVDVAIKVLLVDQNDQKAHVRFQSEAKTASKLSHPNIATIYDFGLSKGKPYLIMEFVDGQSLYDMLQYDETLDLNSFTDIFIQVANAVNHAHQINIVHRDLKPENIIVSKTSDGVLKPKLLDFGIAKSLDSEDVDSGKLTVTGAIVGSPLYMSPEQASGLPVTLKSDLYSLGAIMFRSLAGRPPIQGDNAFETILLVSNSTPPSIADVVSSGTLPQKLCDLIDGLLSKDPTQRPSLSKVVIPTLSESREGSEPSHSSTLDTEYGAKSKVKSVGNILPIVICVVIGAVVLGAVGIGVVLFYQLQDGKSSESERLPVANTEQKLEDINLEAIGNVAHDEDVEHIRDRPGYSEVTDERLKKIAPPTVNLENSNLKDSDLAKIALPDRFIDVNFSGTKLTSLTLLPRFKGVQKLELGGLRLTDGALKNLEHLPLVEKLILKNTSTGDKDLRFLKNLKQLNILDLSATKVTPIGIKSLSQFPRLSELLLMRCDFTKDEVNTFVGDLPPLCSLNVSVKDPTDKYLLELTTKYPDLCVNELAGSVYAEQELVEDLIAESSPRAKLDHASFVLKNMILRLNQRYGYQTTRTRYLYKELGDAARISENWKEASEHYKTATRLSAEGKDIYLQGVSMRYTLDSMSRTNSDFHSVSKLISDSIRDVDEVYGADSFIATDYRIGLAITCKNAIKCCDIALPIFQRTYQIEKAKGSTDPRDLAYLLANIGDCYYWLKQQDQAKRSYASAAKIFSKFEPVSEVQFFMRLMCFRAPTELALNEGKVQAARALNDQAVLLCTPGKFRSQASKDQMKAIAEQKVRIQSAISR